MTDYAPALDELAASDTARRVLLRLLQEHFGGIVQPNTLASTPSAGVKLEWFGPQRWAELVVHSGGLAEGYLRRGTWKMNFSGAGSVGHFAELLRQEFPG